MQYRLSFTILLGLVFLSSQIQAQLFVEKQSRHRFAQLTFGLDYQISMGGQSRFLNLQSQLGSFDLGQTQKARLLIGGTHFWGHADIYLAIPLGNPTFSESGQDVSYLSGVETAFKYYPWRIKHNAIRPFIGVSLAPFYFEQDNDLLPFGDGPELNHTSLPLLAGITYNNKGHLLEAGLLWNYNNEQDYYISQDVQTQVQTPPFYLNFSYRYMIDTTVPAEPDWESGRTAKVTEILAEKGKLNNFYIGIGMSSAFWLGKSSYNEQLRPYINPYSTSIMADYALGYYFHRPDISIAASYRAYGTSTLSYGANQSLRRQSLGLEATRILFDYHGFTPFVGPVVSYERLRFKESFERQLTQDVEDTRISYGLTFGWDIRPNRIQAFILRTNLRWYPDLKLEVGEGQEISFNNIEFNFIQLVLFPDRIF
ncbi:MAG: hypothetical protein KTR30_27930 [Saprospiraceae bacterium]|nr:hypothetical protein [Saprospiraceae bacterium]